MMNLELTISDCEEIIKRKDLKRKDSIWYFFWGVMENDLATSAEAAKQCRGYKRTLVKKARRILDAHREAQDTLKALLMHSDKIP